MSTALVSTEVAPTAGHAWFQQRLVELTSRVRVFVLRLPQAQREEAVAEILGQIFAYTVRAGIRGKLALLTPFTLVSFFGRSHMRGRRMVGTSSTDVLSEHTRHPRGLSVVSIDRSFASRPLGKCRLPLSQALASRRTDQPLEHCRRDLDYPEILDRQHASAKARRVFDYLASTHGEGRQTDLARELRVSPPRIVQLKQQLAGCLAAEGYGPTNWGKVPPTSGRPRRNDPPLNAGTSPARSEAVTVG